MSNYERASGTVTLPAAAVAGFRKALNDAANTLHERVLADAKAAHATISTRSPRLYEQAVNSWSTRWDLRGHTDRDNALHEATVNVLHMIARKPHTPTHADVDRIAPRGTNRTGTWSGPNWDLQLDGRELKLHYDGNHASDDFHGSPVSAAALQALGKTAWTRGSGGVLWYNSEYNEGPSGNSWGGGDRVSEAWGPVGESIRDHERGFSIKSGKLVTLR